MDLPLPTEVNTIYDSEAADSRALYYGDELGGRSGNWVDGAAPRETHRDENHHLAKVRVAGSNPVFRSICAVQRRLFNRRCF